jgi:outer membrane murein-binding lipoprotein Lpp
MPKNSDNDFGSLFDDMDSELGSDFGDSPGEISSPAEEEEFPFDEAEQPASEPHDEEPHVEEPVYDPSKRRTSHDFEPDMDALLITAQSSLIIEGMKCLTQKEFSAKTLQIYTEAIRGVDLYIKILERHPQNYHKLEKIIETDIDCKEVEKIAFHLYEKKINEPPQADSHKLRAFELLRKSLKMGYNKAQVSTSMQAIRGYFLLSGGLDQEKVSKQAMNGSRTLKADIARIRQNLDMALELVSAGDHEIAKGFKGRDVNIFIIKSSQLLAYYYLTIGDSKTEKFYRRMHENYKKYFVVRE